VAFFISPWFHTYIRTVQKHRFLGLLGGPIGFTLILTFGFGLEEQQSKMLAIAVWMIIWWVLEVFPIYITAMIPMVLFPTLGIMPLKDTFAPYASPIVFLFFGGFLIALALEKHHVHKRIAYGLLRLTGTKPANVILGTMLATALIAMWISNTATAVMMLPIGISITRLVSASGLTEKESSRFSILLMLTIAFSANIGGIMTLIGTPPNLVFAAYQLEFTGTEISFASWLGYGVPLGITLLAGAYLTMVKVLFPVGSKPIHGLAGMLEEKWKALGSPSLAERLVIAVFGITVFGWIFLSQINELIGEKVLSNTTVAMAGGLLMFMVPEQLSKGKFLLHWKDTKNLPWGIIILFGGGLALAAGLDQVGLIDLIAKVIVSQSPSNGIMLIIPLVLLSIFLTEIMSNVALVTVLLPVVFGIAEQLEVPVLALALPVTFAASCAFMMPISTPPNAIVYSSGLLRVDQMVKAGFWLNVIATLFISLFGWLLLV